jgi:hypothetical protein
VRTLKMDGRFGGWRGYMKNDETVRCLLEAEHVGDAEFFLERCCVCHSQDLAVAVRSRVPVY